MAKGSSLWSLLVLILLVIADVIAVLNVWRSSDSTLMKVLWTLLIFFLPVVGLLVWFLLGPRGGPGARAGGMVQTGPSRV